MMARRRGVVARKVLRFNLTDDERGRLRRLVHDMLSEAEGSPRRDRVRRKTRQVEAAIRDELNSREFQRDLPKYLKAPAPKQAPRASGGPTDARDNRKTYERA
jgi:hypothetical protein